MCFLTNVKVFLSLLLQDISRQWLNVTAFESMIPFLLFRWTLTITDSFNDETDDKYL